MISQNINWISKYMINILTDENELAYINSLISRYLRKQDNSHENGKSQFVISLLKLIRNFYRTYFLAYVVGSSINKLILKANSVERISKIINKIFPIYFSQKKNISQFSKFLGILLSAKPVIKCILDKSNFLGGIHIKSSLTNLIVAIISIYPFYPKKWGLHTVSWFYLFFAIDYGYKLFEQRQINKITSQIRPKNFDFNNKKERISTEALYKLLKQKSWLIFPVGFSHVWKEHITNPKNIHGLLQNLFSFTNTCLNKCVDSGDFIILLRNAYNEKRVMKINYRSLLLRSIPQSFFKILLFTTFLIIVKNIKDIFSRIKMKKLDIFMLLQQRIREAIKLAIFLSGIPLTANILTTMALNRNKKIGNSSLRLIGFICGCFAFLYRGEYRDSEGNEYSKHPITNRDAWINMSREVVISSTDALFCKAILSKETKKLKSMVFYDKIAFIIGLTTLLTIYDYYKLREVEGSDYILDDAKIINTLCEKVANGNSNLLESK